MGNQGTGVSEGIPLTVAGVSGVRLWVGGGGGSGSAGSQVTYGWDTARHCRRYGAAGGRGTHTLRLSSSCHKCACDTCAQALLLIYVRHAATAPHPTCSTKDVSTSRFTPSQLSSVCGWRSCGHDRVRAEGARGLVIDFKLL